MRILCVIDSLCPGGAQRQMVELALGFKEKGHIVSFLTYHHIPFYNPLLEKAGISITVNKEPSYLKRIFKMRRFIRSGKHDAVLSFLEAPNLICELAGMPFRNWKLVVGERSTNPKIVKHIKLKIYRWFHVFADYIVSNSHANMELVRSVNPVLPESKCKVIYNAIDFTDWKPITGFKFKKDNKIKLIIAARHAYLKNLNGLIEALAQLNPDEKSRITIEWYGDSLKKPYHDNSIVEAFKKIKTYNLKDVISIFPANNNMIKLIQESDAVGLFSFYEGFPNIVCEGMACAKPVLCSSVSDVPIILSHNANLLFNPYENHSIRKALSYLINLSNEQLLQIGQKNEIIAKEKFNKEKIVEQYLQLLST